MAAKMTLLQIIEDNFDILLQSMDPSLDLLGRLRSVPCVQEQKKMTLLSINKPTMMRKTMHS